MRRAQPTVLLLTHVCMPTLLQTRFVSHLSMMNVKQEPTFQDSSSGFAWSSLQFDLSGATGKMGSVPGQRRLSEDDKNLTAAERYLAGVGQSAEGLFVSTIIMQLGALFIVSTLHMALLKHLTRKFKNLSANFHEIQGKTKGLGGPAKLFPKVRENRLALQRTALHSEVDPALKLAGAMYFATFGLAHNILFAVTCTSARVPKI
jgi:hypothetical protein